jgi:hypothetical protein
LVGRSIASGLKSPHICAACNRLDANDRRLDRLVGVQFAGLSPSPISLLRERLPVHSHHSVLGRWRWTVIVCLSVVALKQGRDEVSNQA